MSVTHHIWLEVCVLNSGCSSLVPRPSSWSVEGGSGDETMVAGIFGGMLLYCELYWIMTNTRECGPMCNSVVSFIFAAICWLEVVTTCDGY